MCYTAWYNTCVTQHVLHSWVHYTECVTWNVTQHVLYSMCYTACVTLSVLHGMCYTECVTQQVLQWACYTVDNEILTDVGWQEWGSRDRTGACCNPSEAVAESHWTQLLLRLLQCLLHTPWSGRTEKVIPILIRTTKLTQGTGGLHYKDSLIFEIV